MNSIALNVENEKHFSSRIEKFFSRYQICSILKQCNAYKKQGVPVVQIVRYLFTLVFLNRSMFLDMQSEKSPDFGKDTVYRFKNADYINWKKFTTLLSGQIIRNTIVPTISTNRKCAFIIDDSVYGRNGSKHVELLAKIFDHANKKYLNGFRMLTLCAHIAIVFMRYMFLAVSIREAQDVRTAGPMFCLVADELADISYAEAMEKLQLFLEKLVEGFVVSKEEISAFATDFIASLPKEFDGFMPLAA